MITNLNPTLFPRNNPWYQFSTLFFQIFLYIYTYMKIECWWQNWNMEDYLWGTVASRNSFSRVSLSLICAKALSQISGDTQKHIRTMWQGWGSVINFEGFAWRLEASAPTPERPQASSTFLQRQTASLPEANSEEQRQGEAAGWLFPSKN